MELLTDNGVPLIPVTSKTFSEMEELSVEIGFSGPVIFENGGGIAYPVGSGSCEIEITGKGVDFLKGKISSVEEHLGASIHVISDMEIDEVVKRTNLSAGKAVLAKERRATIPFVIDNPGHKIDIDSANASLKESGVSITKGGRFYHLGSAGADKGHAVKRVIQYIKKSFHVESILTAGIGDSENDIPMLKAVDAPFLVRRHDGSVIKTDFKVSVTGGIGPYGFTEAVKIFLNL